MSRHRAPEPPTGAIPHPSSLLRPPLPPPPPRQQRDNEVYVRLICDDNLVTELARIRALLPRYPYVTVYAEHAGHRGRDADADDGGVLLLPPGVRMEGLAAAARYALARIDVDAYPLLRLGITLSDAHGRVPVLRASPHRPAAESVWQVGFPSPSPSPGTTPAAAPTTTLRALAHALRATGVVSAETWGNVTWVAHGGLYHFGYLLKALTGGAPLPATKDEFLAALAGFLGGRVFDVRYVAARLPKGGVVTLGGPLLHLAALLGAPAAPAAREAGDMSLVACQVFMRIKGLFFAWDGVDMHAGCIHGLHSPPPPSPLERLIAL